MDALKHIKSTVKNSTAHERCVICNGSENLCLMQRDYFIEGKIENYSKMIEKCFKIDFFQMSINADCAVCDACVKSLRYCCNLRERVKSSYTRLYNMRTMKTRQEGLVIVKSGGGQQLLKSSNHPTVVTNKLSLSVKDTKCTSTNILEVKNDNSEYESKVRVDLDNKFVETSNLDDESDKDNWSTTSEQIKTATGYKQELNKCHKPPFVIPQLDPSLIQCPNCDQTFDCHSSLSFHYNEHFPNYLCDICGKPYANNGSFYNHLKVHAQISKFKCELCDRTFTYINNLRHHVRSYHNNEIRLQCYECPERFKETIARRRHMLAVHNIQCKLYPCNICNKNFITSPGLRNHTKIVHYKQKDHKCGVCGEAFYKNYLLKNHMDKHRGINKHRCELCKKVMASQRSLKEHLKIHFNIKHYKCDICEKEFVQKCALKNHLKTHFK